ncbi:hypothetical protein GCM10018953_38190 [Streptosporangium nondiastaticum]
MPSARRDRTRADPSRPDEPVTMIVISSNVIDLPSGLRKAEAAGFTRARPYRKPGRRARGAVVATGDSRAAGRGRTGTRAAGVPGETDRAGPRDADRPGTGNRSD